jgi:hypothetical protein
MNICEKKENCFYLDFFFHSLLKDFDRAFYNVAKNFFFPNFFWWNRSLYCLYPPLPPLRGQATAKCQPRWLPISGLVVHCRLGKLLDSNPGLLQTGVNTNEPPLLTI